MSRHRSPGRSGPATFGWVWGAALYLRSRRWTPALALAAAYVGVLCLWQRHLHQSGGTLSHRQLDLVAVSSLPVVVMLGSTLSSVLTEWEDMSRARVRRLRLAHVALTLVACAVTDLPGRVFDGDGAWVARNALLLLGLCLLWTVLLGAELNWVVPVAVSGICYYAGRRSDEVVYSWAVLLHPHGSGIAILACASAVGGAVLYVTMGPRRSHAPQTV